MFLNQLIKPTLGAKNSVLSVTPGAQNLSNIDAVDLALDPQDSQVLYLATKITAFFEFGRRVQLAVDKSLPKGIINSIAGSQAKRCLCRYGQPSL